MEGFTNSIEHKRLDWTLFEHEFDSPLLWMLLHVDEACIDSPVGRLGSTLCVAVCS